MINGLIVVGHFSACVLIVMGSDHVAVARYVSEVSMIRMVNQNEDTGEKVDVREGFRMGWNRSAFRIFLIDLLFVVSGIVIFLLFGLVAASPLLLLLTHNDGLMVVGGVAAAGMFTLVIFLLILVAIVLAFLMPFFRRAVVLEEMGVMDAIRRGTHAGAPSAW